MATISLRIRNMKMINTMTHIVKMNLVIISHMNNLMIPNKRKQIILSNNKLLQRKQRKRIRRLKIKNKRSNNNNQITSKLIKNIRLQNNHKKPNQKFSLHICKKISVSFT